MKQHLSITKHLHVSNINKTGIHNETYHIMIYDRMAIDLHLAVRIVIGFADQVLSLLFKF